MYCRDNVILNMFKIEKKATLTLATNKLPTMMNSTSFNRKPVHNTVKLL